jgi:ribosomal protein L27
MTELGEQELGEQLVEAAQILLYRRGTTHTLLASIDTESQRR